LGCRQWRPLKISADDAYIPKAALLSTNLYEPTAVRDTFHCDNGSEILSKCTSDCTPTRTHIQHVGIVRDIPDILKIGSARRAYIFVQLFIFDQRFDGIPPIGRFRELIHPLHLIAGDLAPVVIRIGETIDAIHAIANLAADSTDHGSRIAGKCNTAIRTCQLNAHSFSTLVYGSAASVTFFRGLLD
jgi:hypothetical protein